MVDAAFGTDAWAATTAQRLFTLSGRPDLRLVPGLFRDPCPASIHVAAAGPADEGAHELHVIGVYEGPHDGDELPTVRVAVHPTPRPLVLMLMAYRAVRWELDVDPDAQLAGIALGSHEPCIVRCPADVAFVAPVQDPPITYRFTREDSGGIDGDALVDRLRQLLRQTLLSFQGEYRGSAFHVPPWPDLAPVRALLAHHATLLESRTIAVRSLFHRVEGGHIVRRGTTETPIRIPEGGARAVTYCDADARFYVATDHHLVAIDAQGVGARIEPPDDRLSWPGGVAWDTRRRRLLVTTKWHAGDHHLYEPATGRWSTVPVAATGGGIHGLAYDPGRDVVIAVGGAPLACVLLELHPDLRDPRPIAASAEIPFPRWPGADVVAQLAVLPDGVLVSWREDAPPIRAGTPAREQAFLLPRDGGPVLRVALDAGALFDPVTEDFTTAVIPQPDGTGRYEGFISLADLRRDARRIVEQVAFDDRPLMVNHPRGRHAMVVGWWLYHGQVASLDETTFPDWQDRLARATREIAEARIATGPRPFDADWTEQAAEDLRQLRGPDGTILRRSSHRRLDGAVPLDGPLAGWFATAATPHVRLIHRRVGNRNIVGWLRVGARSTYGRLLPETGGGDAIAPS